MFDFKPIIRFFLYAGCRDEDEYRSILPEIHRINRDVLRIVTLTLSVLMFFLIITNNFIFFYSTYSFNYSVIFTLSSVFTLLLWSPLGMKSKFSQTALYVFIALSYLFSTVNGIMVSTLTAVGFVVTLIAMPLLIIDRPIRIIFVTLTSMAFFSLAVIMTKPYEIIVYDLTNVVIYGFFGIIISIHIVFVKVSKLLADKKLHIMSETDLLTGLMNRNSYEENLNLYPSRCKHSLTCIYMDANGLHELNNQKGHKAGDEMLCTIAQFLSERFYPSDTYRIGGDEFVIFVPDDTNSRASSIMEEIEKELEKLTYHASWGLAAAPVENLDMSALIIQAEQMMYQAKTRYYMEKGIDRRKSRK